MLDKNLDVIYNLDYVVCVPSLLDNLVEPLVHSFGNVIVFKNTEDDVIFLTNFIKKNSIKKIIFVNYLTEYFHIVNRFFEEVEIDFLFTYSLASFSDIHIYTNYKGIMDLYHKGCIQKVGVIDKDLCACLEKKGMNVYPIDLDIPKEKNLVKRNPDTIGILSNDFDPKNNFYNVLSAIMLAHKTAHFYKVIPETYRFIKTFPVAYKEAQTKQELYESNAINFYANFTNNDMMIFLKSMDLGVPCILGNTDFLDKAPELKNWLVLKSDDDINEMASKIEEISKNEEKINKLYDSFRKKYTKNSEKSISLFLEKVVTKKENIETEKLLSVIVPVYNVEKYLDKCLASVVNARIDDMEVLVINDGSKDNSEEVIQSYTEAYPDLIRYIKQENHGLGNVRNVGLKESKGKYIASIDSDDTIDKNFFKEALPYMEKDIDVVLCDWLSVFPDNPHPTPALDRMLQLENEYQSLLYATIMPSACNKIVKKRMYTDIHLSFAEGLKFEDLSTNPIILLKAETIKYIPKPYYEYMIREGSIMRTSAGKDMIDIIAMLEQRVQEYVGEKNLDIDAFRFYVYWFRIEEFIINPLYKLEEKERKEFITYIEDKMRPLLESIFTKNKYVQNRIKEFDQDTQMYIEKRNQAFLKGNLDSFLKKSIKNKEYFILTPPLILYKIDNRDSIK
ncbi:MAG: glycosyltransferase [Bacilli bacterium]|nr:glycosyltransferase [Bacilli bacterium]